MSGSCGAKTTPKAWGNDGMLDSFPGLSALGAPPDPAIHFHAYGVKNSAIERPFVAFMLDGSPVMSWCFHHHPRLALAAERVDGLHADRVNVAQ